MLKSNFHFRYALPKRNVPKREKKGRKRIKIKRLKAFTVFGSLHEENLRVKGESTDRFCPEKPTISKSVKLELLTILVINSYGTL